MTESQTYTNVTCILSEWKNHNDEMPCSQKSSNVRHKNNGEAIKHDINENKKD